MKQLEGGPVVKMVLVSVLLVVLATLTTDAELVLGEYTIKIENETLVSVEGSDNSSSELNLSSLGVKNVEKLAFSSLPRLKKLSLANNSFESLPEYVFRNLSSLEILSVAENDLKSMKNVFAGLKSLRFLDISENPRLGQWEDWIFADLNRSCYISTRNSFPRILDRGAFYRSPLSISAITSATYPDYGKFDTRFDSGSFSFPLYAPKPFLGCSHNGTLILLVATDDATTLLSVLSARMTRCSRISYGSITMETVRFQRMGIKSFESMWYRVNSTLPIIAIDLSFNEIKKVTREVLYDLPRSIIGVSLARNKIEKLERAVIENQHLERYDLSDNSINSIEEGAFERTNAIALILNGNRLDDTKFLTSLPSTLVELRLRANKIRNLTPRSFLQVKYLAHLDLAQNRISYLQPSSLKGLFYLKRLVLHENGLRLIDPGAFKDLKSLTELDLCSNSLATLRRGTFEGLESLVTLKLCANKFTTISRDTFRGIPYRSLKELDLRFNSIHLVEGGSFVEGPTEKLLLDFNALTRIERGTFGQLRAHLPINESEEAHECLSSSLTELSLTNNRIRKLENGVLYGMDSGPKSRVVIGTSDIHLVQAGLFEDRPS